jgi:hypothetical protein
LCNKTEIKDKEEPCEIVASTSCTPNFSQNEEECNDPWDDSWVQDTAISELEQSVKIGSYSIAESWKFRKELDPNGLGKHYITLMCHLDCVQCQHGCTYAVETGNEAYVHCLWNTKDWYSTEFIAGFMTMIQHDARMSMPYLYSGLKIGS